MVVCHLLRVDPGTKRVNISISTHVNAPLDRVWEAWTTPAHIVQWNFASPEWCCPSAAIDLTPGGAFSYRMEAKDGTVGFDFNGTFTAVEPMKCIEFTLGDERVVSVSFTTSEDGTVIVEETFDADDEYAAEQQRHGWQAILDDFKLHVEAFTPRQSDT